jgi:hypothetical protein
MSTLLKQSTAVDIAMGPFLDDTDGKTAETALTITQPDIRLKKNGGAWAQKNAAQTLTHEEAGWYEVSLDATDTNTLGELIVAIHESGALPVWRVFQIVPAHVYDGLVSGSDKLQVDVAEWLGTAAATPTVAGVPEVDITHWNGSAVATPDSAGHPKVTIKDGTGAGELDTLSGKVLLQDNAITAAVVDTDAIDGDAIAASAVTELQSGLATAAALATLDARVDTEIPAILAAVDTEVAAIKAKTDLIPAAPAAVGDIPTAPAIADAVWDESLSGHVTAGSAGRALQFETGVAQAGAVGSVTLSAGASATDNYYVGHVIVIVAGTGAGQARPISAYVGATKVATIATNWGTTPDATSRYVILAN